MTISGRIPTVVTVVLICGCLTLLSIGCAQQQVAPEPQVDLGQEKQAIRSVSESWLELDKAHDAAGQAELFSADAVVIWENQEPVVGKAAIQNMYEQYYEKNPSLVPGWSTDRIEIASSGDLAIEYGSWGWTNGGPDGTLADHGKYVTVYRKVDGSWKVLSDTSVSTKLEESAE